MSDTFYKSSTHGHIPLSQRGKDLLKSLRNAVNSAIWNIDYAAHDNAVAKARGEIATYISELESQQHERSSGKAETPSDYLSGVDILYTSGGVQWVQLEKLEKAQRDISDLKAERAGLYGRAQAAREEIAGLRDTVLARDRQIIELRKSNDDFRLLADYNLATAKGGTETIGQQVAKIEALNTQVASLQAENKKLQTYNDNQVEWVCQYRLRAETAERELRAIQPAAESWWAVWAQLTSANPSLTDPSITSVQRIAVYEIKDLQAAKARAIRLEADLTYAQDKVAKLQVRNDNQAAEIVRLEEEVIVDQRHIINNHRCPTVVHTDAVSLFEHKSALDALEAERDEARRLAADYAKQLREAEPRKEAWLNIYAQVHVLQPRRVRIVKSIDDVAGAAEDVRGVITRLYNCALFD